MIERRCLGCRYLYSHAGDYKLVSTVCLCEYRVKVTKCERGLRWPTSFDTRVDKQMHSIIK